MKIELDINEIIPFESFELSWRWDDLHNPNISSEDKGQIKPLSLVESKRIKKVISHFETESILRERFESTEWFTVSSETKRTFDKFSKLFQELTKYYNENLYISWNRSTSIYTKKEIFARYWDDFCYPSSDNITIISEQTNWIYFYNHIGVGQFWKRKK